MSILHSVGPILGFRLPDALIELVFALKSQLWSSPDIHPPNALFRWGCCVLILEFENAYGLLYFLDLDLQVGQFNEPFVDPRVNER